jgi:hypothetical protein
MIVPSFPKLHGVNVGDQDEKDDTSNTAADGRFYVYARR